MSSVATHFDGISIRWQLALHHWPVSTLSTLLFIVALIQCRFLISCICPGDPVPLPSAHMCSLDVLVDVLQVAHHDLPINVLGERKMVHDEEEGFAVRMVVYYKSKECGNWIYLWLKRR